ncbi:MAG TPA: amino acid adenylation domain-containing protein [Bryobacteraceae bacterium]|nr:amino acid adenylation domain-containing protein [Bryobacteraceae bacterium]
MRDDLNGIAIIGMAGRFPGARSVAEFWRNQKEGVESISHFTEGEIETLDARGAENPDYVKARPVLDGADEFDAAFFGVYPKEAELMDPQHRVFLECCWAAFEDAGYDPSKCPPLTGVYAGCSPSTYFLRNVCRDRKFLEDYTGGYQVENYPALLGSNVDFLATRVAYKLNLKGPAFTLQAGCSTSLLAVCQAAQALQSYQCDMALAGGVSITFPQKRGYLHQEGGMVSPDGHCRPFDAEAAGTVFGSGSGVVLLKRVEDAIEDGDHIYAVIRGYAVNNDGAAKVGYTAPSVEGQAQVIAMAHASAGVDPETITYIEAHGTGTPLGDPIEIAALTQAFRARTDARQFCAIGTAKASVGHLDIAAGVTGLIRAAMAVHEGLLPPTLHFRTPNPKLKLQDSPFYINAELRPWADGPAPRRAGVSAFGVGGTNAHVVLEQAPAIASRPLPEGAQVLTLSAKSGAALDAATENLARHLESHADLNLADVAFTLREGRRHFEHRRFAVAADLKSAPEALRHSRGSKDENSSRQLVNPRAGFLFPGQGSQYPGMGQELYQRHRVFRDAMDRCARILRESFDFDLLDTMFPPDPRDPEARRRLSATQCAQPAIFAMEYALAQLWISWGAVPAAMTGHSIGEFVAACLAEVFSLEDGLSLVAMRGRMMQALPAGAMLSVRLAEPDIAPLLNGHLALAATNSPMLSVISGPLDDVEALERALNERNIANKRLSTSHAFHSAMMEPVIEPFTARIKQVRLSEPKIPYVSTATGTWITAGQATDPQYWGSHLRHTVRFSQAISTLLSAPDLILLEVGPGRALTTLARQHSASPSEQRVIACLPDSCAAYSETFSLLKAAGSLWLSGYDVKWNAIDPEASHRRVSLPEYPFERKRFWLEPPAPAAGVEAPAQPAVEDAVPASAPPSGAAEEAPVDVSERRRAEVRSLLSTIFEDLSGADLSEAAPSDTFLDMGFDSLFLTQVSQAVQKRFQVKVTFRQLLDQQSTLESLTEFIDKNAPVEALPVVAIPQGREEPEIEMSVNMDQQPGSGAAIERLMKEQLEAMNRLMAQQLATLQGSRGQSPAATPVAPAALAPPAPVAAAPKPAKPEAPESAAAEAPEFKPFGPYKPVQKDLAGGLTDQQRSYVAGLIERYTKRTAGSKRMTQQYRGVLADPRVVSGFRTAWKEMVYPIVTVRSRGSRLWDVDGNEYIDILNGFGPTVFGHLPDFVTEAVQRQMEQGIEIGPQSPLAGEVAQTICQLTGMERATFCNTGSEAVIAALRLARTVTGRSKVVLFAGSYHGTFDEVLVKGIKGKGGALRSFPIAPGIPREKTDNVVVLEYGAPESLAYIEEHAGELAAVLVEPVQSRHPALQPRDFVARIREITRAAKAALIFDEVVTGFRSHSGGVQALWNIRADLATYGKVLGGGLPIGVLAGSAEYMDALDGGSWQYGDDSSPQKGVTFFAGTFVRHPLALAACRSVLEHLKKQGPDLQQGLNERTAALVGRLNQMFEKNAVPVRIQHFSSFFYFAFPADQHFGSLLYYNLRAKGVHIQEGFPCFLTTAHSDADLEQIYRAFEESVHEMQAGGVLATPAQPASATTSPEPDAPATAVPVEAPLTESQLEVFLSAQLDENASCGFNEAVSLRLDGGLDEPALRRALDAVAARHESLRARFDPHGESQRFAPPSAVDLPVVRLHLVNEREREQQLDKIFEENARTPFDLVNGPAFRAQLIQLGAKSHLLLFTAHHVVCDGWSMNVLMDELAQLYSAFHRGSPVPLPEAVRFSEYARTQAAFVESAEGQKVEQYWVDQFREPAPLLDLPLDRPRPPQKSYEGATLRRKIGAESYRAIKKAGAQHKCTLFVTLLAGFEILMNRLSGQDDVVVGVPAAGQSLLDGETLVGHCVNFLPMRARFNGEPSVADFLGATKKTVLDAYDHQNYTYGRLIRKLNIPRDQSRLPLVEIQFNLERVGGGASFDGLASQLDPNAKAFVNHDIFLNVMESPDGLTLDCDYNTRLFDEATVSRWLGHYETLLAGLAADPAQPVSRLPLLSAAEQNEMAVLWNQTDAVYARNLCVHQIFEEHAARTPDAIAAVYEESQLTYAELNYRADRLAGYLAKLGVKPGVLVGVFVDRSIEMIIALLGVMKAGGAYVPMDPTYPAERISFVLDDASVPVLLTQEKLIPNVPGAGNHTVVALDAQWEMIEREGGTAPSPVNADNLVYVIYTSGSTGKPKGVEISHRAVVNLLSSMRKKPGFTAEDVLLAVTTLSFDIAALELYLPLVTGGRLVIASREAAADGAQLLARLESSGATVLQATPITFRLLMEAGWKETPNLKVLCGGEALPRDLANQILERTPSLWNMYGPTETTIWSSTIAVEKGEGPVTLGPPIDNTQFYVLDRHAQLAPIGVAGELYIGGDGLARGYFHRPELTAEKFVPDHFRGAPGARLYRTGDLVRRMAGGQIDFLGRLDHQVKLRGYRIELGEIETALSRYPGVREAVVMVREDVPGDKRLVAYLATDQQALSVTAVREFLTGKLPNYMLPAAVVRVEAMPLTPNGKVDRRALPAPDLGHGPREKEYVAPRTEEEKTLAGIWSEVLRLERVGIDDNLFELGADSLHIFQIAARANKAGIHVAPAQFLKYRTITSLLDQVKNRLAAGEKPLAPITRVSREKFRLKQPVG